MERVSPHEVVAAFQRYEWTPTRGTLMSGDGGPGTCGCALGVLTWDRMSDSKRRDGRMSSLEFESHLGLSGDYLDSFMDGFDEGNEGEYLRDIETDLKHMPEGPYKDGVLTWFAVRAAGLVPGWGQ